ncbi:MAG: glycosyltransferase [Actinomycetales bacterium]
MVSPGAGALPHVVSVVVPVYRGERTLPGLCAEIGPLTEPFATPDGHQVRVGEVLLVFDNGPDRSAEVIRTLAAEHPFVRPVWLSRNFGQHAATLAGMSSSGGDWVVTLDEDGQHDPRDIARLLDVAMREQASVVYARPTNAPPHGRFRNLTSRAAKWVVDKLVGGQASASYHSYRLMLGEIARGVGAYAGAGVYLDVALGWIAGRVTTCPVEMREEGRRESGYTLRTLASHFWRMVLTSGTRLLRLVSVLGVVFGVLGLVIAVVLAVVRLTGSITVAGWTSVMVVVLVGTGAVLFSLGIVAEYLGVAVNMAMGKPLYLITSDPKYGPLGREPTSRDLDAEQP